MSKVKELFEIIQEDAGAAGGAAGGGTPTNSVGTGNIAGEGVGPYGEPPGPRHRRKKVMVVKRKALSNDG